LNCFTDALKQPECHGQAIEITGQGTKAWGKTTQTEKPACSKMPRLGRSDFGGGIPRDTTLDRPALSLTRKPPIA